MTYLPSKVLLVAAGFLCLSLYSGPGGTAGAAEAQANSWNVTKSTVGYVKRRDKRRVRSRRSYHWHTNADYREVVTPVGHYSGHRFYGFGRRGDGYRTSGKRN